MKYAIKNGRLIVQFSDGTNNNDDSISALPLINPHAHIDRGVSDDRDFIYTLTVFSSPDQSASVKMTTKNYEFVEKAFWGVLSGADVVWTENDMDDGEGDSP